MQRLTTSTVQIVANAAVRRLAELDAISRNESLWWRTRLKAINEKAQIKLVLAGLGEGESDQ